MVQFSQKIADLICERMAGGQSLSEVCRAKDMPARQSVLRWLREDEAFRAQYERAREDLVDYWADEILNVAYATENDTHTTTYENGGERTSPNTEWISRSRLKVDSLKWLMSKLAPKKYGDKMATTIEGGETPVQHRLLVSWNSPTPASTSTTPREPSSSPITNAENAGPVLSHTVVVGKP